MAKDRYPTSLFRQMITECRRGDASADLQTEIADLLENLLDSKGRPRRLSLRPRGRPKKLIPDTDKQQLAGAVDELWDIHRAKGSTHPQQDALEEVATLWGIDVESARRYFSKGVELLAPGELRLAARFERLKQNLSKDEALACIASEMGMTLEIAQRKLDRARRREDQ